MIGKERDNRSRGAEFQFFVGLSLIFFASSLALFMIGELGLAAVGLL